MGDAYLVVYLPDGESVFLEPAAEPSLDAGVEAYHSGIRDRMLILPCVDGRAVHLLASEVKGWSLSTPESRRREVEWNHAMEEERKGFRADLGVFDEER